MTDVIIVGGGFAGLCAASAFSRAGKEVLVLEASQDKPGVFRGELLHPPGVDSLHSLGLEAALERAAAVPVSGFAVLSPRPGQSANLPYRTNGRLGRGFEHNALVASLRSEVEKQARVRVSRGSRVGSLEVVAGRVVGVRTDDGTEYRARLVIAADGRHSRLRKLAGIETDIRHLSHMTVLGVEGPVLPEPGRGHVFVGAGGPILAYPYADDHVRICIDVPTSVAQRGRATLVDFLKREYTPILPPALRDAINAELDRGGLSGCANHAVTLAGCARPGLALLGDAGGCTHPLTATGMTTALRDIELLLASIRGLGLTDAALVHYQRERMRYVRARAVFAQALYDVFRGADPASAALRDAVFDYWSSTPRAQQASIAILTGEQPELSRFLGEFSRVAGLAAWQLARKLGVAPRASASSLRALVSTLAVGARTVQKEMRDVRAIKGAEQLPSLPRSVQAP